MNPLRQFSPLVTVFVFGLSLCLEAQEQAAKPADPRHPAMKAKESYERLFQGATQADVSRWRSGTNDSLALCAAWHRVRETLPQTQQARAVDVDPKVAGRFLGFVEARLKTDVPSFWEEALFHARAYDRNFPGFALPRDKEPALVEGDSGIYTLPGVSFKLSGSLATVTAGDHECKFSADLIDRLEGGTRVSQLGVAFDEERCYLAPHTTRADPFRIIVLNRKTGDEVWRTEVWAAGYAVVYTGVSTHFVHLAVKGDRLILFGCSEDVLYVEVFSTANGSNLVRFCTYF